MSGNQTSMYGPAAALVTDGATAHVSPYRNVVHMTTKDFPRDKKGRFKGY
jgi:hypothetical protein